MRGDRLRIAREGHGLTQKELAQRTGVHEQQIHKIEVGISANPNADTLTALSKELEVSVDYLLGLVENPKDVFEEEQLSQMERKLLQAIRRKAMSEVLKVLADMSEMIDKPAVPTNNPAIHS